MNFRLCLSGIAAAVLLLCNLSAAPPPADATAQALHSFDDMKFGMFIHWGLYAIPAGEWKGRYVRGIGEWIMFREKIPVKEYEQLASRFNPVKFSGDEWAQLARDAGMRYLVITSKHHDGFSMFDSKVTGYDIVDTTPFHRDPMKALSEACARRDIGFGFYYSQDQDWHEPNGRGNEWDFPKERRPQVYLQNKVLPQVKEILSNYGKLSLIWFDTPGLLSEQQVSELRNTVKTLQPNCLLNSRIGHGKGDYMQTGDNAIPIQVYSKLKWEVPATLNDTWGYKKNDENWKDPADLIAKLADIVSKGGNYLLNVGPTAEGVIPPASQQILRTMGRWLAANGESIYGAQRSPFYFPDITWRCTVKPGRLYIHLINWPGSRFRFEGLSSEVKRAYFLANRREVKFSRQGQVLQFELPAQPVDPFDSVLVLEIADQAPRVDPSYAAGNLPEKLDLYAWTARLRGEELRYDKASASASNFRGVATERNELWWYPYGSLDGNYEVEITYACDDKAAGSAFQLAVHASNQPSSERKLTGTIEGTGGRFVTRRVAGWLRIAPADQHISFGLVQDDKSAAVRVRKITITRRAG